MGKGGLSGEDLMDFRFFLYSIVIPPFFLSLITKPIFFFFSGKDFFRRISGT